MNVKKDNRREGRLSRGKQPRLTDKEPKEEEEKGIKICRNDKCKLGRS